MRLARSLTLTLLLSLAAALTAHAKTLTINRDLPASASVVRTSFAADAASHRAWVVVDYVERTDVEELVQTERVAVPGLSYDPATRTIRLQDGDQELTCAVGTKVLWATAFRATADCPIRVEESRQGVNGSKAPADKTDAVVELGAVS
ncbi:MAG TPA: hypothetical protein VOA80_07685 [Thermoanaerobaculia bacterium]|nr:hypothetical protein [Thermoanaerobaculia bacterium]